MKNGWIPTPENFEDLPWNIKAGKRVLWWIDLEACGEFPAKGFAITGSIVEEMGRQVIEDKEAWGYGGGYFYESVRAYKEIGKSPHED